MTFFSFYIIRRPPSSTLFPYTTLFRSHPPSQLLGCRPKSQQVREDFPRAFGEEGILVGPMGEQRSGQQDRKSTRLNSSHLGISYAVFCLKKKKSVKRDPQRSDSYPAQH